MVNRIRFVSVEGAIDIIGTDSERSMEYKSFIKTIEIETELLLKTIDSFTVTPLDRITFVTNIIEEEN